ncbi:MAG: serine hydrolase [Anaerolineales bacterium]|nr:serine hydrolase [Anaerolineales bacterium]
MSNFIGFKGFWRLNGYNKILVISESDFILYDSCPICLVESERGSLDELNEQFDRLNRIDPAQISMYEKGGITRYTLDKLERLPELPVISEIAPVDDPELNFEVFWHYFNDDYAFFDLRRVDWQQVYKTYRPHVSPETTGEELLAILGEILEQIGDLHVSLTAGDRIIESAKPHALQVQLEKEYGRMKEADLILASRPRIIQVIQEDYLNGQGSTTANDMVIWGKVTPHIGYLNILAMWGMAGYRAPLVEESVILTQALDRVMQDLIETDAVIVDVRLNPGGHDALSLMIANRFADKKRLAFSKKARLGDNFTESQDITIYPQGDGQFTGPVVLLTSKATVSAAEIFTLSMMSLPHVTRMGESTQGVLSDVLPKRLPNGWLVGISNEVYTACDGQLYEGSGIPVHQEVPVFLPFFFYSGLQYSLDKAVMLLTESLLDQGKIPLPDLDSFIRERMAASSMPGVAACLVQDDRIAWSGGYGWAVVEKQIPMTPDTIMNIASVSKTVTTTAVMQLWEKGKFRLDDNVNDYLPFSIRNPGYPEKHITFRHLLTHTSSIIDSQAYEGNYGCGNPSSLRDWISGYLVPGGAFYDADENFLPHLPGEKFEYSNVAFGLLGLLVESISGESFEAFCQTNIFDPLGMDRSFWNLRGNDLSNHAIPYTFARRGEIRGELLNADGSTPEPDGYLPNCLYQHPNAPDGFLHTSVRQLSQFLVAMMNGGSFNGQQILEKDTVELILSDQLDFGQTSDEGESMGLCWYRKNIGDVSLWMHTGGDPGVSTIAAFCPELHTGVIAFTNTSMGWGLEDIAKRLFHQAFSN